VTFKESSYYNNQQQAVAKPALIDPWVGATAPKVKPEPIEKSGGLMSQSIVVWRGWRMWIVAARLSGTLALAGTMQLAQAQQSSPQIAFRSTTWNALHTELGRVAPPVGWAFVMTRNGQEIFVDQGGFSRAPWESRDASLPFTVDTQIFVASVSKAITNAALMTIAQDRNTSLDVFLDMKLREVFPEKAFGQFVGNISLRNLIRMRSGLGPVLGAGQQALSPSCIAGNPSFDLWNCLVTGSPGQPGILARDLPCDPHWPTREGPPDYYLNENYLVLRAVVEKLAGQDYCTYVKHRVLNQPGEASITCDSSAVPPVLYYGEDMSQGTDFSGDFRPSAGPVGWYASTRELMRFLNSLRSNNILRDDIRQRMFTQEMFMLDLQGKGGTFWEKGGGWTAGGTAKACIVRFSSGVDAALVMNSASKPCAIIPRVYEATLPVLATSAKDFIKSTTVTISSPFIGSNRLALGEIRFTTDGTEPSATSELWAGAPITLTQTATIKASIFDHQTLISGPAEMTVNGPMMPAPEGLLLQPGVHWQIFDRPGSACWNGLPDLSRLTATHHGINATAGAAFNLSALSVAKNQSFFAAEFGGYLYAPADDVYAFGLPPETSRRLVIDDRIVVGNIALKKGLHSINLQYFHEAGPGELKLEWSRTGNPRMQEVPSTAVFTRATPVKPELPQLSKCLPD
jgi:CubicO group peptidase (beta-lactamase class C family)